MRFKLIIANWKMNGSFQFLDEILKNFGVETQFGGTDQVVICPPYIYLPEMSNRLVKSPIQLGAQNLSDYSEGAYTGEISAEMLLDTGCNYVIVGHSERRALFNESNDLVARKAERAIKAGLTAVVCVGETLEQRQQGVTEQIIAEQLAPVLAILGLEANSDKLVIAYEPVWAIGTGETATPEQAQNVHAFIRAQLGQGLKDVPLLYGGSVKPGNAAELFAEKDIDGGLIGGASLVAEDFLSICRAMPA